MRQNKLNGLLALLILVGVTGCKSMPSLTWWKTASKPEEPSSTALAHDAPALPSEVALQQEAAAAAPTSSVAAAPYVSTGAAGVSPAGYPATTAPAFEPATTATAPVASTEPAAPAKSPSVGSIAMPYNPKSVPPAPSGNTSLAQSAAPAPDRYSSMPSAAPTSPSNYGMPAVPTNTSSVADTGPGVGSRYASSNVATEATPSYPSSNAAPTPAYAATTAPASTPAPAPATGSNVGDRYAQSAPSRYETSEAGQSASPQPKTVPMYSATQQNLAAGEPYRPGGTSSYPGAQASQATYNVATRPEEAPSASQGGQEVPNVATPESTTAPPSQRYW